MGNSTLKCSSQEVGVEVKRIRMKKKIANIINRFVIYSTLIICSFMFFFPFFLTIMNSLQSLEPGTKPVIPEVLRWKNYYLAVTLIPFFNYLKNSFILVVIALGIGVPINLVIGYAFARLRAPGKNVLFTIVLSTMMIPGIVTMIPQYILFSKIGLTNTFWIWILGALGGNAFSIFLFRQFFAAMPRELEEAAKIDGCSVLGTIFRIFVPCAKPVLIVVCVNAFMGAWGDYMGPFMYLAPNKYPLAMALFGGVSYKIEGSPDLVMDALINCAAIIMTIPSIAGFFISQKYIVEGIVTTGIKG
jgi:multiple sugar transport system permease protein